MRIIFFTSLCLLIITNSHGQCKNALTFNNLNIPSDTYKSGDQISSNGIVQIRKNVFFNATNSIKLTPGFHAQTNSKFNAKIEECKAENVLDHKTIYETRNNSSFNREKKDFYLFPNPTSDKLNIIPPSLNEFDIVIYDAKGVEVLRNNIVQDEIILDLKFLTDGLYLLNIINSEMVHKTYKIMIKH